MTALDRFAGDSTPIKIVVMDQSTGDPFDLSNCLIAWGMIDGQGNERVFKVLGDGIDLTDAVGGVAMIRFQPDDTRLLSGQLRHECVIWNHSGFQRTLFQDIIRIHKTFLEVPQ